MSEPTRSTISTRERLSKISVLALGVIIGMLISDLVVDRSEKGGKSTTRAIMSASAFTAVVTLVVYIIFG